MPEDPRSEHEYSPRQVEAARRVIIDVMQVLASFNDCLVLVGGWIPELLIEDADEPHVGSIDVDLALDAARLNEGRYAKMLELLLATQRYRQGEQPFQFVTEVDLKDGGVPVVVDVEFLAPKDVKTEKNRPKLIEQFRVLKADGCSAAFHSPLSMKLPGRLISGAENTVQVQVASVPDFRVMKAFALRGRDKPKDAYDLCFCLDHYSGGIEAIAESWRKQMADDPDIAEAAAILEEKFASVEAFGPMQVVAFHDSTDPSNQEQQSRRAYELVQRFLTLLGHGPT